MYCISSAHLHSTVETACNCGPVAPRPAYADSECTGSPGRHSAQPDRADPPGLSLHQDVGHSPRHLIHLCATHSSAPLNRKERSDCLPTQHRPRPRTQPSPENVPVHHMPLNHYISYPYTILDTYIAFVDLSGILHSISRILHSQSRISRTASRILALPRWCMSHAQGVCQVLEIGSSGRSGTVVEGG